MQPTTNTKRKTQRSFFGIMAILTMALSFLAVTVQAQIGVTVTNPTNASPNLQAAYTSLASALADLNLVSSMNGPVTLTLNGGTTEQAPTGGFVIGSASLNPALSSVNTVTINTNGAVVTINAAAGGTSTPGSATPDGIISIRGADYVTIDGLTLTDGNSASAAVAMEFGIGLFKLNPDDGCNNNTIKNCVFNMQRVNNLSGAGPMMDGSVGILLINATATAATTALTPTNGGTLSTNGTNSNNKFYSNTINGGNTGIGLSGYAATLGVGPTPLATGFLGDVGNDAGGIGALAATTGNTILNFGGGGTVAAAGIRANNQWSLNVSNNLINNNNGSGVSHNGIVRGIYGQAGISANVTISYNTVTVNGAAISQQIYGIDNAIGSTAAANTVNIINNTIQNCTWLLSTAGSMICINSGSSAAIVNVNNNSILNNTVGTAGTTIANSQFTGIFNQGTAGAFNANTNTINNNRIVNNGGSLYGVRNTPSTNITVNGNTISNLLVPFHITNTGASKIYGYSGDLGSGAAETITNNNINNLSITGTSTNTASTIFGIASSTIAGVKIITGNNINTLSFTSTGTGYSRVSAIFSPGCTSADISRNIIHTVSTTGAGSASSFVSGIALGSSNAQTFNVYNNLIGNLSTPNSTGNNLSGIYCDNSSCNMNVYFNTIYLNGTSNGAGFSSAAIFMASSVPTITLKNNILVNVSTPTGTGITAALRGLATSLSGISGYATGSDYNLFYAGTPSANRAYYFDGTNAYGTAAASFAFGPVGSTGTFQNLVTSSRELHSFTEVVSSTNGVFFQSLTGPATGSGTTFLHLVNGLTTQCEGGGIPVSSPSITTDYDGDTRNATTPDVGADEFNGNSASPVISNVTVPAGGCVATSHVINADIVATSGTLSAITLFYNNGTSGSVPMTFVSGNTYTATIPSASPANTTVTWSINAVNSVAASSSYQGTGYQDEILLGVTASITAGANPVCLGSSTLLTATLNGAAQPSYVNPSVSAPTNESDISNVTISRGATTILNNTTTQNSLAGTIGTATGTAGGYSNFSAFGPYELVRNTTYNLSVSSVQTSGLNNNIMAAWIDYNGNGVFTDPGEQVFLSTPGTGNITRTGSFTVPSTAVNGLVRIRVLDFEGTAITGPTQTVSRGEWEEYLVSLKPAAVTAYSWTDGSSTLGTASTLSVSPVTPTTYSVMLTAGGCSLVSGGLTITQNPLPAAPATANYSTQCGSGHPAVFVTTGGGGGGYRWYLQASDGTAIPGETGGALSGAYSIGSTTHFWVAESNGTCESPRVEVIATVNTPDPIQASVNNASVCLNSTIELSVTNTAASPVNTYTYSWASTTGSGLSGSTAGNPLSVTPAVAGTYTYTVTGNDATAGCMNTSIVVVTINALPGISSATATPSTAVCPGTAVTLNAANLFTGTSTIGTGIIQNAALSQTYMPPYGAQYTSNRHQILVLASELTAQGMVTGSQINSLAFDVATVTGVLRGFTIKIGHTSTSNLNSTPTFLADPTTQVYTNSNYTPVVGWNTHNFSTPFIWNGTSNIVVETYFSNCLDCSGNNCANSTSTQNAVINQTTTAFNSHVYGYALTTGACAPQVQAAVTSVNVRPNMRFTQSINLSDTYNWVWNPGNQGGASTTVNPTITSTYTVMATNPTTACFNTATVTVTVSPLPPAPSATNGDDLCGTGVSNASVSSNNTTDPQVPPFFKWYSVLTGGSPVQSGTSAIFTTPISATTSWYVSEVSANGCEGPRVQVTTNVTVPDPITVNASVTSFCFGGSFDISSSYTSNNNAFATFDLSGTGGAGSGITGIVSLIPNGSGTDPYTITPTAAGTYTYTITATDPDKGCSSVGTVIVTVNAMPAAITSSSPGTICRGGSSMLSAYYSGPQTVPSYTLPGTTNNGGVNHISLVNFNNINNVSGTGGINGFVDYTGTVQAATANPGNTYSFTLHVASASSPIYSGAWFDWNRNGVYDASEFYNVPLILGVTDYEGTINITVPVNAVPGIVGLRIRSEYFTPIAAGDAYSAWTYGETEEYAVNIVAAPDPSFTYTWNPGGLTGTSVSVSPTTTTTYTLTALNALTGCVANLSPVTVTVNQRPGAVLSGGATYCNGQLTTTSLNIAVTGAGPWSGFLSDGTPFSGATSPISVSVTPSSTITYTIATLNGSQCTAIAADLTGSATVTINPVAATPTATVLQPTCALATGTITVTAPSGTGNSYTLDGTTTITWPAVSFPGVVPGIHTITVANSFGCSAQASASVTVNPQPFIPGTPVVNGIINVCPHIGTGEQITYHATATGNGTQSFNWQIPPANVTIVSGQGTANLTLSFQNGFATQANKQLRLTVTNDCGTSLQVIYYLLAQAPVTPNPITGPTDACPLLNNPTGGTYTINKANSALYYIWTAPAGASIQPHTSGVNDTTITVLFNGTYSTGNITVQAFDSCGASGIRSITVYRNNPSAPGLIAGPTNACAFIAPNGAAATYSVTQTPGMTYTWTTPAGVLTGNPISFTYPAGFLSGTISVTATNGCGTSGPRNLSITKLNPATPGVIDVIQTAFCGETPTGNSRVFTYTLASMPANATSVLWTVPTTAVLENGQGTISITVRYPDAAVNGAVTVQATNNCAVSTTRSITVKIPACPPPAFTRTQETNNNVQTKIVKPAATPVADAMEVKIFPNPTVNDFKLEVMTSAKEEINVRIIDAQGRLFKSFRLLPHQAIILGAELRAGSYLIEVRQGREVKITRLIRF